MFLSRYESERDEPGSFLCNRQAYGANNRRLHLPHFHNAVEIAVGIRGESEVLIGGESYRLRENTVLFIDSFIPHKYNYSEGTERYVLLLGPDLFTEENGFASLTYPVCSEGGEVYAKLRALLDFAQEHLPCDVYSYDIEQKPARNLPAFRSGIADLCGTILQQTLPSSPKETLFSADDEMLDLIRYIGVHSAEDLSIASLAKKFGWSPNYLSHRFNAVMGVGFREYLNFCRAAHYYHLKRFSPEITVGEAVSACGFGSAKTFYRAIKKYVP